MKRSILYTIVVILINIASTTLFFRVDLTENKSYSLSNASKELVRTLEEPLTIKVFLSENLPVPYNNIERDIRDILMEYKLQANHHFNYTIDIIHKDDPTDVDPATYNIFPINIQNIEQDEMKVVSAYIGMAFIHGDLTDTIPAISYDQNLELTITEKIRALTEKTTALLSMSEPIKTTLYLSPILYQLSDDLREYPQSVESEIDDLKPDYFNRVSFDFVETDNALYDGMTTLTIEDETGGTTDAIAALVVETDKDSTVINIINQDIFGRSVVSSPEDLKFSVQGAIDKLIGAQTRIGYLTSNGAISISGNQDDPGITALSSLIYNSYTMTPVDLSQGEIDRDIQTLIIARPLTKFTDRELFILDQFLMGGNSILLALDQIEMDMSKSNPNYGIEAYKMVDHGLLELLNSYGIKIGDELIMDELSFKQSQRDTSGSIIQSQIYFAPLLLPENINSDLSYLKGVNELITFRMSEVDKLDPEDKTITSLFSTSESAWSVPVDALSLNPNKIVPPMENSKYSLAVIKEGGFTSYFKGKEIPQKVVQDSSDEQDSTTIEGVRESESLIESSESGKIMVLGSSDMLTDSILSQNYPSNMLFIQNALDYLSNRGDYTLMRSKGVFHRPMVETTNLQRNFIKYFNILGLPLIVAICGFIIYILWLRRKKEIMTLFSEDSNEK